MITRLDSQALRRHGRELALRVVASSLASLLTGAIARVAWNAIEVVVVVALAAGAIGLLAMRRG